MRVSKKIIALILSIAVVSSSVQLFSGVRVLADETDNVIFEETEQPESTGETENSEDESDALVEEPVTTEDNLSYEESNYIDTEVNDYDSPEGDSEDINVEFVSFDPAYAGAGNGVYQRLMSLQSKFPNGRYWNHVMPASEYGHDCTNEYYADFTTTSPCYSHNANAPVGQYDCNYFDGGWQCCGFAKKIFFDVFGERESSNSLIRHYGSSGVQVGDYVHFSGFEHYAVVLTVGSSTFTVVECNLEGDGASHRCEIRWGHTYNLSQIDYYVHSNNWDSVNSSSTGMDVSAPIGCVDFCEVRNNQVYIQGWTYDPDEPSKSLQLHIYIDNETSQRFVFNANHESSDVNSAYGISGNHRFAEYFTLTPGTHRIRIFALNSVRNDNNPVLGSSPNTGTAYYVTISNNPSNPTPSSAGNVSMYRLYNPNSGEHFYTSSAAERNNLINLGWNYEGVGWIAPSTSNTPVYRLYNQNGGEHHYTTSLSERNNLIAIGWSDEGIGWYSDDNRTVPLYRQYNPNEFANNHNYTTSQSENNYLVSIGWRAEGIGWYGVGTGN